GVDHTATPDGPQVFAPALFTPVILGTSVTVYARQIRFPVAASKATTLPRNVQHSYLGLVAAMDSSRPETGTYSRPAASLSDPVITAIGCSSARTFHCSSP